MNTYIDVTLELSTFCVVLIEDNRRTTLLLTKSFKRAERAATDMRTAVKAIRGKCGLAVTCSRPSKA